VFETLQNDEESRNQFALLIFDIFTCLKNNQTGEYDKLLLASLKPLLEPHFNKDYSTINVLNACLPVWLECLKNSDYYFSAGDLQLVAKAYEIEMIIVDQNSIESENPPDDLLEKKRVIFHRGLHFSFCELQ
jgi:hypothetical protein